MRAFNGRGAKGFVVTVFGAALLLTGCSQSMMADKEMMEKEQMTTDKEMEKK